MAEVFNFFFYLWVSLRIWTKTINPLLGENTHMYKIVHLILGGLWVTLIPGCALCVCVCVCVCARAQLLSSCLILWDSMDCSPPGSSVQGIFQARILDWFAISFSRGSSPPRDWTHISCLLEMQNLGPHPTGKLASTFENNSQLVHTHMQMWVPRELDKYLTISPQHHLIA